MKKYALSLLCLGLGLLAAPFAVRAQSAAPEMFGVNEIILQSTHFTDPDSSDACGLSRDDISAGLMKDFSGSGAPVIAATDAKPITSDTVRIELVPEIATYSDESLGCVSWVSLTAESHNKLSIPPINTFRTVTVVYWRQGVRVGSGQTIHAERINEVLKKMAAMFVKQYKIDQPPPIPSVALPQ